MDPLFKEFLGLIEPKDLSSTPVAISALDSLAATASADAAVKMVFSFFDNEPIADTAPVDPFAYFGIMAWNGMADNERSISLNLCGYVDADSAVYWSDNSDAGWPTATGFAFDQGCVQLAINNSSTPAASDLAGLLFAVSLSKPLPTTSTITTTTTTSVTSTTTTAVTSTTIVLSTTTIPITTTTTIHGGTTTSVKPGTTTTSAASTTTSTVSGSTTTTTTPGTSTTTTSVSAGPCPATKVLGVDNPKLENLRAFRDSKLAHSAVGRRIIKIYYNDVGSINSALERSPALRAVTRKALEVIAPMMGRKE